MAVAPLRLLRSMHRLLPVPSKGRFTLPILVRRACIRRAILIAFATAALSTSASAKRTAPTKVEPVIHEGIRYVAPNADGRRAYVEARDAQTSKKLWDLTVFTNPIDPKLEEDVQWVFIKSLAIRDGKLMVTSERGATYQIDLHTRAVEKSDPAQSPAANAAAQHHDIPESVQRAMGNSSLVKNYDLSLHMDPFYLSGDFNGDGKIDVAVLVKQRSTGKLGIAIVHGESDKITVLGAGTAIGNGGDDFAWMDTWQVYSKSAAAQQRDKTHAPHVRGDALLVGKNEAASALIYWNGKRYVWHQQGD